MKQFAHVYISQHIVNVLLIHQNFAASRRSEQLRQLLACSGVDIDSDNLITRRHAVAQMCR